MGSSKTCHVVAHIEQSERSGTLHIEWAQAHISSAALRHISTEIHRRETNPIYPVTRSGRAARCRRHRSLAYRVGDIFDINLSQEIKLFSRAIRVGAPSGRRRRLPPAPGGTVFILLYPIKRLTPTVFRSIIENNFIAIPLGVPSPAEIIPFEPAQGNACLGSKDTRCLAPARRPASGGFAMAPKR